MQRVHEAGANLNHSINNANYVQHICSVRHLQCCRTCLCRRQQVQRLGSGAGEMLVHGELQTMRILEVAPSTHCPNHQDIPRPIHPPVRLCLEVAGSGEHHHLRSIQPSNTSMLVFWAEHLQRCNKNTVVTKSWSRRSRRVSVSSQ